MFVTPIRGRSAWNTSIHRAYPDRFITEGVLERRQARKGSPLRRQTHTQARAVTGAREVRRQGRQTERERQASPGTDPARVCLNEK